MKNKKTIVEVIKQVLQNAVDGMTAQEIYKEIMKYNLYYFGAKKPEAVVHAELRTHCINLDFPTASPVKYFYLKRRVGRTNYYALIDKSNKEIFEEISTDDVENEIMSTKEKFDEAYILHMEELKEKIIDKILNCRPEFFERLVVNLLLKMGYGYDNNSGSIVEKLHDGGIDGIINEDKLGLSKIYIQAKRYSTGNNVGSHDIQAFVGAMQSTKKGVFITTSEFTKEAKNFVNTQQQKQLRLINGHELAQLIIQYEVGLEPVHSYTIYRIDDKYFDDE